MLVSADSLRIYGAKPALTFDDSLYRLTWIPFYGYSTLH